MKKIYLSIATSVLLGTVTAQQQTLVQPKKQGIATPQNYFQSKPHTVKNPISARTSVGQSAWINHQKSIDVTTSSDVSSRGIFTLFPDSNVLVNYSNGAGSPSIHLFAEIVDIKSPYYLSDITFPTTNPYNVDSIAFEYAYTRKHIAPTDAADTLLIYMFTNATATNMEPYPITGQASDYNTDTVWYRDLTYNYTQNKPSATGVIMKKVILTNDDTTGNAPSGGVYISNIAALINLSVPANKLVGCAISFKPGYAYTTGQNIEDNDNVFYLTNYEEKGVNTYPNYFPTSSPAFAGADWSCTFIANTDVRYNVSTNGWNGFLLPEYTYLQAYSIENSGIYYKITDASVVTSAKELTTKGFSLGQNVPNPYSGTSVVPYSLAKDASSVLFTVTDVMGRVLTSEKANTTTGTHSVKLVSYPAGIYYYSLNVDGKTSTHKMIVE